MYYLNAESLFFMSESEGKASVSARDENEVALKRTRNGSHRDPLEKMRDMLQREWGRREVTVMERCQGMLSEFSSQGELTQ